MIVGDRRQYRKPLDMSLASLLAYTSAALAFVAFIFFLIGFARSRRLVAPPSSRAGTEQARLRTLQHADWKCGAGLLGVALAVYAANLFGTGVYFNEPSGNLSGGVLLITGVVGLAIIIALIIRHVMLSHALRKLD